MPRLLIACFILALLSADSAESAIPRWDALPALDVRQSQGPYAGQTMCPICRHGYDAGVLVLLPGDAGAKAANATLNALDEATHGMAEPRFRVFVVLLEAPTASLLDRLARLPAHWHVGTLLEQERAAALAAFGETLADQGIVHVFAQRRSLRSFEPLRAATPGGLAADIDWALEILDYAYATPATSQRPDTPKGLLWSAASRLDDRAVLQPDANARTLCFAGPNAHGEAHALVGLRFARPASRQVWARTDATGCVTLQASGDELRADLFAWRARPIALDLSALDPAQARLLTPVDPRRVTGVSGSERLVGGPCDGCDAVFTALPSRLPSVAHLIAADQPGEPLRIRGRILDSEGRPRSGVVVYAYQTNAEGHYPPAQQLAGAASRHGRLRGWALSDQEGRYGFETIRPASYPDSSVEQHVHMHVIEPGRCTYYIGDLLFDDDPKLSSRQRQRAAVAHGGSGIVPAASVAGTWQVERDIRLGLNVKDYSNCAAQAAPDSD